MKNDKSKSIDDVEKLKPCLCCKCSALKNVKKQRESIIKDKSKCNCSPRKEKSRSLQFRDESCYNKSCIVLKNEKPKNIQCRCYECSAPVVYKVTQSCYECICE